MEPDISGFVAEENKDPSEELGGNWNFLPDSILLNIFQYLSPRELLDVGLTCKTWLRVSYDEFLWKDLFYFHFHVDPNINILPGKKSWLQEYKRLTYHTPFVQTEILKNHTHQVLHVGFAHNGKLFATCSKDGSVLVWDSGYPAKVKYCKDMKVLCWKYTQFCQFNQSDTLLLVSGVLFGIPHSAFGEIAVFGLQGGFNLQCRVVNQPYDIFGTWYSDNYLLSGNLHWLGHLVSSSILWLNKASQEISSEHVPVVTQLYRFYNCNASSIRAIMVADCLTINKTIYNDESDINEKDLSFDLKNLKQIQNNHPSDISSENTTLHQENNLKEAFIKPSYKSSDEAFKNWTSLGEDLENASPIYYNKQYRNVETQCQPSLSEALDEIMNEHVANFHGNSSTDVEADSDKSVSSIKSEDITESSREKLLIFTTGSRTFTPHQIGFKRIKAINFPKKVNPGPSLAERIAERARKNLESTSRPETNSFEWVAEKCDKVDHLIDLHGHIIGMGLSPDHRYLYVNSRPWPQGCVIQNPLSPPPIAQEIDIHVIDLVTLKEVGKMLRAHKAFTPNNECFYIFLNVSNEYVASGAEDKHGYLWDRHYGICIAKYPHTDVVNSVAFNPRDPEMLVTTSDDFTIKIWRSKNRVNQLKIKDGFFLPKGLEIRLKKKENK